MLVHLLKLKCNKEIIIKDSMYLRNKLHFNHTKDYDQIYTIFIYQFILHYGSCKLYKKETFKDLIKQTQMQSRIYYSCF